jgi:hypothetical protein
VLTAEPFNLILLLLPIVPSKFLTSATGESNEWEPLKILVFAEFLSRQGQLVSMTKKIAGLFFYQYIVPMGQKYRQKSGNFRFFS